jgi:outer membrane protein TolC
MALGLLALLISQTPSRGLSLEDAVREAFRSRGTVQAAATRVFAAEANRSALGTPPGLRAEFGGGTVPDVGTGNDFMIAQPIDLFGKTSAARSTGKASLLAAKAALKQAQIDLQTEVFNSFSDLQSAQTLYETGKAIAEIAQQAYDSTKKRIDAGDLPPAQLLRADLELERATQTLAMRAQAVVVAKIRFAAVIGKPVSLVDKVEFRVPNAPQSPQIEDRADLAQLKSEAESASAQSRVAAAARWPDMEIEFSRTPFDTPEQYNLRVQFVLPLYDYGASRQILKAARLTRQAADREYMDRLDTARAEVHAARLEVDSAKSTSEGFDKLSQDAKSLISKEQRAFAAGANTLLDVLDATRALRDIEESAADARAKWIQAEGRYLSATGTLLVKPS